MDNQTNNQPKPPVGNETTPEVYTDGFCQIYLVNGAIKIDLLKTCPTGNEAPQVHIGSRLVMTLQQFLLSVEVANNMVNQLVKAGVISDDGQK